MSISYEKVKKELLASPKTWLVTGIAGFIGSNLLEALLRLNQKVIGIDNFSTGSQKNIDNVLETLSLEHTQKLNDDTLNIYKGDICNLDDCLKVTKDVDYVLHQAALGSIPRSIKSPELSHASNATGFVNLLIAAKESSVKRVVYASSSSVYGDSPHLPKQEDRIGNPLSPYAVSKYVNELYAKAFAHCYQMDIIGLRYFNVFGPRQNPNGPYAAVIPCWLASFLKNEPVYINGDGETTRDFCFISNAVQANILAATTANKNALNKAYNIAANEQISLNQLFQLLAQLLNLNVKPSYREFRFGDIRHSLADISRASEFLGYVPTKKFNDNLAATIKWYCPQ